MTETLTLPDGYYAVRYNGTVGFYQLRTSKGGKWDGFQWVNRFRGDLGRVGRAESDAVRAAIATDTDRAAAAFAQDLGLCYRCGRVLTDDTSRTYGIGPVCAKGGNWSASERVRIDAERIEPPVAVASGPTQVAPDSSGDQPATQSAGTLTITDGKATLVSEYDAAAVSFVRTIPGRKWDADRKVNTFPVTNASVPALTELVERFGYEVVGDPLPDVTALRAQADANAAASKATDADIEVAGLGGELMPFQKAGVAYAIANGSVLIGDEMGLGKTIQALAALQARDAFPALVVSPAVVKLNWQREAAKWLPGRTVEGLEGRKPRPTTADIVVVNYDIVDYWKDELKARGFKALVADESHYLKNSKAKRTKAVKALAKKVGLKLFLTGTPILNRPIELVSQLDALGYLEEFGGFWGFAKRYCNAYNDGWGWDMTGASNLDELNEKLRRTCYVRRTKEQVLSELPAKRRATVPMELTDRKAYEAVESDLRNWYQDQVERDEEFQAKLEALSDDEAARAEAQEVERRDRKGAQADLLVKINALRQTAARQKLDAVKGWVGDFLESGKKLVVFAHHRDIVNELADTLGADRITGDTSLADRQTAVDRFQNDDRSRVLVANIAAGGVGITLTAASDVAFAELPWRPGDLDQAEDRCHRIGQSDSVTAWYLLGADTIEEDMAELLDKKRKVVAAATEGGKVETHSILADLLKVVVAKGEE